MFRISLVALALIFSFGARAQTYSLQQCIDSALAANIPVKKSALLTESEKVGYDQARLNQLPYVNADINHGLYNGRSIDPVSNSYVTQTLNSANYQLNTGVVLFNGGSLRQTIRQNEAGYQASKMELQQARDNLVLSVILAYLQVLSNEDLVASAEKQAGVSKLQLDRLEVLNREGAIKPSELSDLQGQLMNDQLAIVNARNALESSRLALLQLMNKPYNAAVKIERMEPEAFLVPYAVSATEVYQNALKNFALIKAVSLRTKSNEYGVKVARGGLFPTLSLGGALNTNYSSIAQDASGKIPYDSQLKNNVSSSVGIGISIPIFNRLFQRNQIKLATIRLKSSELDEAFTKQQLGQQVDQAYLNMTNAYERYKVLVDQVRAYTESFKAAEVRYAAGVGTSIDYLVAKDRLDRANLNLINARYDFVLRKKILDYYNTTIGQ